MKKTSKSVRAGFKAMVGKKVICRGRDCGVHAGTLVSIDSGWITLRDSRRIWSWTGAKTLSEVSQNGISGGNIAVSMPEILLRESDVCELLPINKAAEASIISADPWV